MNNTTTIHARIDSELKENVEAILSKLGLTPTDAIKLFYNQILLNGGLPFEVKIPAKVLAEQKLIDEIEIGEKSAINQGWISLSESKKRLGL